MRIRGALIAIALSTGLCLSIVVQGSAAGGKAQAQIARGEYLVKGIGQCGDCHTPFTMTGGFVMDKWLQGKKLEFGPLFPIPFWADTAPNIAGLPGWDTEKAVEFLNDRTGAKRTAGATAYARLSHESRRCPGGGGVPEIAQEQ